MNMFVAGNDLVRWEVTAVQPDGPYRLAMHHAQGSIVEYFRDVKTALSREAELEALLIVAKSHGEAPRNETWVTVGRRIHS